VAKKYRWHKIAETKAELQLVEKTALSMEAGGKKMCLAKFNDQLFACANTCPHASGVMSNGWVDEFGNIVCPLHRYKFSLATGRNTSGEGYFLKIYPIEERPDGIYVGVPEAGLFGW
jgi:nitrite reductase/ring-hydroxylating ferredoxin subunit